VSVTTAVTVGVLEGTAVTVAVFVGSGVCVGIRVLVTLGRGVSDGAAVSVAAAVSPATAEIWVAAGVSSAELHAVNHNKITSTKPPLRQLCQPQEIRFIITLLPYLSKFIDYTASHYPTSSFSMVK
jgi:tetrahydrodipicolinate N-succinyltransferase